MANEKHLETLRNGVDAWNKWRDANPLVRPGLSLANLSKVNLSKANLNRADFRAAYLSGAYLGGTDLTGADLTWADLRWVYLSEADLSEADLSGANLIWADLSGANLSGANLREAHLTGANLSGANLSGANLSGANLSGANLQEARLVKTNLDNADLTGCHVYGIFASDLRINEKTEQSNLIISRAEAPTVTVDDLEVAQFIHLLLNRQRLRNVIDIIKSKAVLILGRFTPERKAVRDAITNELRKHNLLPIIFDFERAVSRDFTETIKTLAGLSLFVIADITNPKSAPLELQTTIPDYQIPFVPIIQEGEKPFSMFSDLSKYPWMLTLLMYPSLDVLLEGFKRAIIDEAFEVHKKLLSSKAEEMKTRSVEDYLGVGKAK
jgi:uncharacterized protein YjbI with pentapeptide repeats